MSTNDFKKISLLILCVVILGVVFFLGKNANIPPKYTPQFVLISFDGSKSIDIWRNIRELKEELVSSRISLNVTHFINGAYFLTEETRKMYQAPDQAIGYTTIGVSDGIEDVRARIEEANRAVKDGDEIAVHTVGHFSGREWPKQYWLKELASFDEILFNLKKIYPTARLPELKLDKREVIGFRAPYLEHSPGLYLALHELPRYRYDTSEVASDSTAWPTKDASGLWHIPLGRMKIGPNGTDILAMDYNLYLRHSNAQDTVKKGTAEWKRIYEETLAAFLGYFEKNYAGTRAPVLIGYHFQMWNDGAYWEALKTFARQVCGKPEVRCVTFRELVEYLDTTGVPDKSSRQSEKSVI
jgi:hypothetical protein